MDPGINSAASEWEDAQPPDVEDTKRRLHIGDQLVNLSRVFDTQTTNYMRRLAIMGAYEELYALLLKAWKRPQVEENSDLVLALILAGLGANYTFEKISQDMD